MHVQKFGLKVCLKQWHCRSENLLELNLLMSQHISCEEKISSIGMVNILATFSNIPTVYRVTLNVNCIQSVNHTSILQPFAHSNLFFFPPQPLGFGINLRLSCS